MIMTTVVNQEIAHKLAKELVERKLAACVSMFPVESTYFWEGKIEENQREYLLIIKTLEEKIFDAIDYLRSNHPYAVPEIVTIKAKAHGKYADWVVQYLIGL